MKARQLLAAALFASMLAAPSAGHAQQMAAKTVLEPRKSSAEENELGAKAKDGGLYPQGRLAIREGRWSDAAAIFTKAASDKREPADAALYWKAYAENKQGQTGRALETCLELRRQYPSSSWREECGALEIEIRAQSGQPIPPQAERDDDLKLLALNSLMKQDEGRALPEIQQILEGDLPEKFKERALFILAQGQTKPAQELLERTARGPSHSALQAKAAEALANRQEHAAGTPFSATDPANRPITPPIRPRPPVGVGIGYAGGVYYSPYCGFGPCLWDPWVDPLFWPLAPWPYAGYSTAPNSGKVQLQNAVRGAQVYINRGYAGEADKLKTLELQPGVYELEVRSALSNFQRRIYVLSGKTLKIDVRSQEP
jgi:hypothetical protein